MPFPLAWETVAMIPPVVVCTDAGFVMVVYSLPSWPQSMDSVPSMPSGWSPA